MHSEEIRGRAADPAAEAGCALIDAAVFDYGGVLAEEGFREGMYAIARAQGLDPEAVLMAGADAAYGSGWVEGRVEESVFWAELAGRAGVRGEPAVLRQEVLSRFVLRPWVPPLLDRLTAAGLTVALLSDQTNWLDELEARDHFLHQFDLVVNSYRSGTCKRNIAAFSDLVGRLGLAPERVLFVDDNPGNVERACAAGLRGHLYRDRAGLLAALTAACPALEDLHA